MSIFVWGPLLLVIIALVVAGIFAVRRKQSVWALVSFGVVFVLVVYVVYDLYNQYHSFTPSSVIREKEEIEFTFPFDARSLMNAPTEYREMESDQVWNAQFQERMERWAEDANQAYVQNDEIPSLETELALENRLKELGKDIDISQFILSRQNYKFNQDVFNQLLQHFQEFKKSRLDRLKEDQDQDQDNDQDKDHDKHRDEDHDKHRDDYDDFGLSNVSR